jgi:nucleoid-associated protein YgaU
MGRDFKIGMILGLVLAVIGLIWVATRPSLSPEARMVRASRAAAAQNPSSPRTTVPTDGTSSPGTAAPHEQGPVASASTTPSNTPTNVPLRQTPLSELVSSKPPVDTKPAGPDLTIYEQAEKIKTTRFHIVRKDETLSMIARQYYGSPNKWRAILEANRDVIRDANRIQPGTKLIIPEP